MNGSTVIYNDEYIDEITRHRDIAKRKWETENMTVAKEKLFKEYENWEYKLEDAISFQDTVEYVHQMDIPNLTVCKTLTGRVIPAKNLQCV